MTRTTIAVVTAAVACGLGCSPERDVDSAPAPAGPPSIVLISIDTTRADRLGTYGLTPSATPNIDAWAAEGVVFENASTPVPITLPAHTSMLTGLLPHHHGARDNGIYRVPRDVPTLASRLSANGYDTAAVVGAAVLDRQYGVDRGFEHYDDGGRASGGGLAIAERSATSVTDAAITVSSKLEAPYFLFVHYFDPHATYQPPAPYHERFRDRPYQGELAYVDAEIGRLRRELDARSLLGDTVVVITSDHGESLGEHGEAAHGVFLYQSTLHVPLIVVAPGRWPSGARIDGLVSLVDIAPTLYQFVGLEGPDGLDGIALEPSGSAQPRWLPLESELGLNAYGWAPLVGITDGKMKWIGAPRAELYDLSDDPSESRDLSRERADDVARLRALYREAARADRRSEPLDELSDSEQSQRLAELSSLGYVAGSRGDAGAREGLVDPKDAIGSLAAIHDARQLMSDARPGEAALMLEEVVAVSPRNTSALVLSGAARLMNGEPSLALRHLQRAEAVAPRNADVHFNLGLAWLGVGRADEAELAWKHTLALAPRHEQATINVVDLLVRTNRADEADAILRAARGRGLESPLFDYLDGKIAILSGDRERAHASLTRALEQPLPEPVAADARKLLSAIAN